MPADSGVMSARRLLGLDATAGAAEIEQAVDAALSAIRVPDDAPDLAPMAAHLHRRLEHARAVLLTSRQQALASPAPTPPLPPTPPAPPVEGLGAYPPAAAAGSGAAHIDARAGATAVVAARARQARRKRAEHTRARVHALVLVLALLVLGVGAFAVTRALSRPSTPTHGASSSPTAAITSTAAPTTTAAAPSFAARLVAGDLGRSSVGIDAASAQDGLHVWLTGFQDHDSGIVSSGIDTQSRLMDLAEIGTASTQADLDQIKCQAFGSGRWRCKVGAVTSGARRVEVSKSATGWRVRGWIG